MCNFKAKIQTKMIPTQNMGMAMPIWVRAVRAAAYHLPFLYAAINPMTLARRAESAKEIRVRGMVTLRRLKTSGATGTPDI